MICDVWNYFDIYDNFAMGENIINFAVKASHSYIQQDINIWILTKTSLLTSVVLIFDTALKISKSPPPFM